MQKILNEQFASIEDIMKSFSYPWYIAGGWSIDLALGQVTRIHDDIDICIFREHTKALLNYFAEWDIQVAIPGEQRLEACQTVNDTLSPRFGLHVSKQEKFIEILLTDKLDNHIIYRRNPRITMPINHFACYNEHGVPFVNPIWQLLFKEKEAREKDVQDLHNYLPYMSLEDKKWLTNAIKISNPTSTWLEELNV